MSAVLTATLIGGRPACWWLAFAAAMRMAQEASTQPRYLPHPGTGRGRPIGCRDASSCARRAATRQRDAGALGSRARLAAASRANLQLPPGDATVGAHASASRRRARSDYRLLPLGANAVRIEFLVDAAPHETTARALPKGVLRAGALSDFPVLYKDDSSLFTAIVAGGLGVYSDGNAWFGQPELFNRYNPLAGHCPGVTRHGPKAASNSAAASPRNLATPFYAFGALTGMKTWSVGQDIYHRRDARLRRDRKGLCRASLCQPRHRNYAKLSVGARPSR